MTTLTITKTVDLTTMSDDTLTKQVESNRENCQKITRQINAHILGEQITPGDPNGSYHERWVPSLYVSDLAVGDVVAVRDVSGTRYSYGSGPKAGEDITEQIVSRYRGWSLYAVVSRTAKRVTVRSVTLPDGYYDYHYDPSVDEVSNAYADWPGEDLHTDTWGDKGDRFIYRLGTLAEMQARIPEMQTKIDRYTRAYTARVALRNEAQRRQTVAEQAIEDVRKPLRDKATAVNKAVGFTLVYFDSGYGVTNPGHLDWGYEMRGDSFTDHRAPKAFLAGLAWEAYRLRRLAGLVTDEQHALVTEVVSTLTEGPQWLAGEYSQHLRGYKDSSGYEDDDDTEDEV